MAGKLKFKPVTAETAADFETLFGRKGGPKWCWCMAFRATPDEIRNSKSPERRKQILGRVKDGVPIGLLAYENDEPVAWVSVAPKDTFQKLGGAEDTEGVWSLTCLYVPRDRRRQGLATALVEGAVSHVRKHKGRLLEAYPVDADSPSYRHMGFVPTFEKQGFKPAGMAGSRRHVMQLSL
jgi:GNAT superfamily N-acetyltransferase